MAFMTQLLHPILRRERHSCTQMQYLYMVTLTAVISSLLIHSIFLLFFIWHSIPFLIALNLASIAIYLSLLVIIWRRKYAAVDVLLSLEVMCYSFLATVWCGTNSLTFMLPLTMLVLQIMLPYAKSSYRALVCALLWLSMLLSVSIAWVCPIRVPLIGCELSISLLNITVVCVGITAVLMVCEKLHGFVQKYNQRMMLQLEVDAYTDTLTGLYNRRYAQEIFFKISSERQGEHWFVAIADIDDFKRINDTYGHATGDVVLAKVAKILKENLRSSDYLFRWGGEEFLILLRSLHTELAVHVLEKVHAAVESAQIVHQQTQIKVTVTLGTAPLNLKNIDASIARADECMYQGKQLGKNQVCI